MVKNDGARDERAKHNGKLRQKYNVDKIAI